MPDSSHAVGKNVSRRAWYLVHKWSSLGCTIFLAMLCLTGLPLIFSDEIASALGDDPPYAKWPATTPAASLDRIIAASRARYPAQIVAAVFVDDDEPKVLVAMAPTWAASQDEPASNHVLTFDARSALLVRESDPPERQRWRVMALVRSAHVELFAGLPGMLLLGSMGLLFALAVVSGAVLYGPFMRKLDFGTVRSNRSVRMFWLDWHNLLGISVLVWTLVLGVTGALNAFSIPLFALWQRTDVQEMLKPWQMQAPPGQAELASLQAAFETATRALPGMHVTNITFPGSLVGSPHHYLLWAKGSTPLTSRLYTPVLVDARSGELTALVRMPWYLRTLQVSRPLHFGDYGGLPLKILWTLLDLITLVLLGSGLVLWFARRRQHSRRARPWQADEPAQG